MKFRHAAAAITVVLVMMSTAAAQTATPAKAGTAPAAATSAAKPGANPAADPATPGMPTAPATAHDATAAVKPGDAAQGQGKAAVCGACHGMDGNSTDPQYPKLAGQSEAYIVRQLTDFKAGTRSNPIMAGFAAPLSPQDMHDIGAYFATKKPLPGVADQALVEQGQTLFRSGDVARGIPACMACHGPDGRGNPGAMYPQLTSQHANYIQATLKAWHDGGAWGTDAHAKIMPPIAQKLDDKDIAALASYIEGLHSAE
ncbi:cytochrome c553 [Luteibacter sp. Sphag1AF]|uniref:c-type cytochrome n=1 Tax=Luteibacter sp. Sphag1AF TaxID=2587031 RepID=UPI0017966D05|nr:c-type cytochrome [Luteibacter sp. Sphag1AF]MBB3226208.1 cytochrome c553 [Luteibacter sp. Sphag1AF]